MKGWILLCLLLTGASVLGQEERAIPERPEGRIVDQARLFKLEPERLEILSKRLVAISDHTGYQLYVVVFDSLIGSSVEEEAFRLKNAWLGDEPGAVLVLESDSGIYMLGWEISDEVIPELGENALPPQEQIKIRQQLQSLRGVERGSTEAAEALVGLFADGVEEAFETASASEKPKKLQLAMLAVGLIAGMLLVGLLVAAWVRRVDRRAGERLVFPEVKVGMRLGAPYGGGKVTSRSFREASSDET